MLTCTHSCCDQFCCLQTGGNRALPGILKRGEYSEVVIPTKHLFLLFRTGLENTFVMVCWKDRLFIFHRASSKNRLLQIFMILHVKNEGKCSSEGQGLEFSRRHLYKQSNSKNCLSIKERSKGHPR